MPAFPSSPYTYQQNIPVLLACGCEAAWKNGFDLYEEIYAYCATHGDTRVARVLVEPQYLAYTRLVNATPHPIRLYDERDMDESNSRRLVVRPGANPYLTLPPSGLVLNAQRLVGDPHFHEFVVDGVLMNIPVRRDEFPAVDEPPSSAADVRFVVSLLYASARRALGHVEPPLYTVTGAVYESAEATAPCGCLALSLVE